MSETGIASAGELIALKAMGSWQELVDFLGPVYVNAPTDMKIFCKKVWFGKLPTDIEGLARYIADGTIPAPVMDAREQEKAVEE